MHVEEFTFDMVTVQYVSQGTMKPWNMNDDSVHGQYVDIKIIDKLRGTCNSFTIHFILMYAKFLVMN